MKILRFFRLVDKDDNLDFLPMLLVASFIGLVLGKAHLAGFVVLLVTFVTRDVLLAFGKTTKKPAKTDSRFIRTAEFKEYEEKLQRLTDQVSSLRIKAGFKDRLK